MVHVWWAFVTVLSYQIVNVQFMPRWFCRYSDDVLLRHIVLLRRGKGFGFELEAKECKFIQPKIHFVITLGYHRPRIEETVIA